MIYILYILEMLKGEIFNIEPRGRFLTHVYR